jgi:hypothetical protein
MPRNHRDRSVNESRFPEGTLVIAVLAVVLMGGLYLIIAGLA